MFASMYPDVVDVPLSKAYTNEGLAFFVSYIGQHPREAGRVRFKSIQFGEPEDSPTLVTYWRDYDRVYGEKVAEYYAEHVLRDTTLEETVGQEVGDSDDDEVDEDQEGDEDSSDEEPIPSKKVNMSGSGPEKIRTCPKKSDAATKKSGKSSTVSKGGSTLSEASEGAEEEGLTSREVSGRAKEVASSGSAKPEDKQQKPRPRQIKKSTKSNIPSNPIPPADLPNSNVASDCPIFPAEGSTQQANEIPNIPNQPSESTLPNFNIVSNNPVPPIQQSDIPVVDASLLQYDFLPANLPQNPAVMVLPNSNLNMAGSMQHVGGFVMGGVMNTGGVASHPNWGSMQQNYANYSGNYGSGANYNPNGAFGGANYPSHLQQPSLGNTNHPALVGSSNPSLYNQLPNMNAYTNTNSYVNPPPQPDIYPNGPTNYQTIDYNPYDSDVLRSMTESDPPTGPVSSTVTILSGTAPISSNVNINSATGPISSTVSLDSGQGPITSNVSIGRSASPVRLQSQGHGSISGDFSLAPPHPPPPSPPTRTLPPPPKSPEPDNEELENEPPNEGGIRRSGRAPAPSTRREKQNEIAVVHVKEMELGEEFDAMQEKWEKLEQLLDYGKLSKGTLANAGGRPSEWKSWISKTRNGQRDYDHPPRVTLSSTPEFGEAIVKYWHSIQPAFRQSKDEIWPLPVYSSPDAGPDPWESLKKGGPNGLVCIITMLAWWGRGTRMIPRYSEDPRPMWRRAVAEVDRCFDEMLAGSLKRLSDDKQSGPRKRARQE
ncbi:hypothetical protein EST38_g13764 [Candolleomyces aberdarensis]|uniref:Uncharacterized protein n=1 Tax=Candolleomyces aberdarensis TaxID=2316362 RepID=A0A4Q2CYZ3_9AGAR|nr:hypothetical protein EST38_g13764 [Candolleomyces aberdarensis]